MTPPAYADRQWSGLILSLRWRTSRPLQCLLLCPVALQQMLHLILNHVDDNNRIFGLPFWTGFDVEFAMYFLL
jgi:hypothetical protein